MNAFAFIELLVMHIHSGRFFFLLPSSFSFSLAFGAFVSKEYDFFSLCVNMCVEQFFIHFLSHFFSHFLAFFFCSSENGIKLSADYCDILRSELVELI